MDFGELFGGLDVAGAPEIGLKDGTYEGTLLSIGKEMSKKNEPYLVTKYSVKGLTLQDWQALPLSNNQATWDDTVVDNKGLTEKERYLRSLGYIQARLDSLGVPKDRMNNIKSEMLAGLKVAVTVKANDNGFPSITKVAAITGTAQMPVAAPVAQPAVNVQTPAPVAPNIENPFGN